MTCDLRSTVGGLRQPHRLDQCLALALDLVLTLTPGYCATAAMTPGTRGFADGLGSGMVIGLPPILNFGSDWLKREVAEPVIAGDKFICLAITEAFAGSDVMGIRTTARKQPDGSYIVRGTKKVRCTALVAGSSPPRHTIPPNCARPSQSTLLRCAALAHCSLDSRSLSGGDKRLAKRRSGHHYAMSPACCVLRAAICVLRTDTFG